MIRPWSSTIDSPYTFPETFPGAFSVKPPSSKSKAEKTTAAGGLKPMLDLSAPRAARTSKGIVEEDCGSLGTPRTGPA